MRHIITSFPIHYLLFFCVVIGSVGCEGNHPVEGITAKQFRASLIDSFGALPNGILQDSSLYTYGINCKESKPVKYQHAFSISGIISGR